MSDIIDNTKSRDLFTYLAAVSTLAAGASQDVSFNIESDSQFIWLQSTFFVKDFNPNTTAPLDIDISIRDAGSGRNIESAPVNINAMAGDGKLPFILPRPRLFKPSSTVTVKFTNNTASAQTIKLFFQGVKTWDFS